MPKLAVKLNVLPSPGALSTQIRPCIIDTSVDEIASPRPVPPNLPRRRTVGLAEGLEDRVLVLGRDADPGVGDGEAQHAGLAAIGVGPDGDEHVALLGELDRVAHEVDQNLAEPERIADERCGNRGIDVDEQLERLLIGAHGERPKRFVDHVARATKATDSSRRRRDSIFEKSRMSFRISSSDPADVRTVCR